MGVSFKIRLRVGLRIRLRVRLRFWVEVDVGVRSRFSVVENEGSFSRWLVKSRLKISIYEAFTVGYQNRALPLILTCDQLPSVPY